MLNYPVFIVPPSIVLPRSSFKYIVPSHILYPIRRFESKKVSLMKILTSFTKTQYIQNGLYARQSSQRVPVGLQAARAGCAPHRTGGTAVGIDNVRKARSLPNCDLRAPTFKNRKAEPSRTAWTSTTTDKLANSNSTGSLALCVVMAVQYLARVKNVIFIFGFTQQRCSWQDVYLYEYWQIISLVLMTFCVMFIYYK